jgi:hypothetical protein
MPFETSDILSSAQSNGTSVEGAKAVNASRCTNSLNVLGGGRYFLELD